MSKQAQTAVSIAAGLAVVFVALAPPLEAKSGSQAQNQKWEEKKEDYRQKLVWPGPPDLPRIRWVNMIRSAKDILPPKKQSIWKRLAGAPDEAESDFNNVAGIAVDSRGRIYLPAPRQNRVFVLDEQKKEVLEFTGKGWSHLNNPAYIDIDHEDRAYVSDSRGGKVVRFEPDGTPAKVYGQGKLGKPLGVAVDGKRRRLYVADGQKHHVAVFDTESGELIRTIGEHGATEPGKFNVPIAVAVDRRGYLYVIDYYNYRIQVFSRRGKFVFAFGQNGTSPGRFARPKGIAVDSQGHIYVADTMFGNIQIFDQKGQPLMFFGGHGTNPGHFVLLEGLFIDSQDRIYTTERYLVRVQVFQYVRQPDAEEEAKEVAQTNGN
jgi:DNA-binding beta-propeller fold protein YncE